MGNKNDFAYLVWTWLEATFPGRDFAYVVDFDRHLFYFSLSEIVNGEKWPAVVALLQGFGYTYRDAFNFFQVIHTNEVLPGTGMAEGMAAFIYKKVHKTRQAPQTANRLPEGENAEVIWGKLQSLFNRIHGRHVWGSFVLTRDLSDFLKVPPGDPHVNLRGTQAPYLHRLYMMYLVERVSARMAANRQNGYPIAALMASHSGRVLGCAQNTVSQNYTYHAQVNLVQAVRNSGTFTGADPIIYTTLKPCIMCAGMIKEVYGAATVIYLQDDRGAHCSYHQGYFPAGRMIQIGSKNSKTLPNNWLAVDRWGTTITQFKPVRQHVQSEGRTYSYGNLATSLDQALGNASVIGFLRGAEASNLFGSAAGGLRKKYLKYQTQVESGYVGAEKEVVRVVHYLTQHWDTMAGR